MTFLRQSTSQVVRFGPFLDPDDGVTEETSLTISRSDMRLSKDGGAFAQKNTTGNATHDSDGWYSTTLDTTDTDTVGELIMNVQDPANALPVWERWWVIEEAVYDGIYGASAAGPILDATDALTAAIVSAPAAQKIRDEILPVINTAFDDIPVFMALSSDHVSAATGLTLGVTRSIDGDTTFDAATGTATETENGMYSYDASAADMNGSIIVLRFTGTAADDTFVVVKTGG